MTEIIKVRVLDVSMWKLSPVRPVRLPPGERIASFLSGIMPEIRGSRPVCFTNYSDHAVRGLERNDFQAIPPGRYLHVLAVINQDTGAIGSLSELMESARNSAGEEVQKALEDFLHHGPRYDEIETPFHSVRVTPMPFSNDYHFSGDLGVISCNMKEGRLLIKYYDHSSIKAVSVRGVFAASLNFEPVQIVLLRDIASKEELFKTDLIRSAVETDDRLFIEHHSNNAGIELKTFEPVLRTDSLHQYRDTGNRWLRMRFLSERNLQLSRHLWLNEPGFPAPFTIGRDILDSVPGKICDIFRAGANDYYILAWKPREKEALICRSDLGARIYRPDNAVVFQTVNRPISFVWVRQLNSFFVALSADNRLYFLPSTAGEAELIDVSAAFSSGGRKYEAGGQMRSLFLCSMAAEDGIMETQLLVTSQASRMQFFALL